MKNKGINRAQPRVLIIGEDTRSFLTTIRSLGGAGYEVHVICYDRNSPARYSRYIKTAKFYNYQAYTQDGWQDAVFKLIERYQFDVIIPCDERAIYPLWVEKQRLPEHTRLAVANDEALDILFDKWKTKTLAISCDIPVAEGRLINLKTVTYDEIASQFGAIFVIKPLQSFDHKQLNSRQNVTIVRQSADFDDGKFGDGIIMVERYFSGVGEGVSIFAVDGEIKAVFSHRRDNESNGGGSSYRYSITTDPEQLAAVKRICKKVRYTGIAMFEFRRNLQSNAWILVEVNARLWGSLPLALFCGIDFPKYYVDYLVTQECPKEIYHHYPVNHYARALTADLYDIRRERLVSGGWRRIIRRLIQYRRIISGREVIDSFSRSDFKPFLHEVMLIMGQFVVAISKKIPVLFRVRSLITRYRLKTLMKDNPNRRFIFICYGNIMRSPFAEQVLRNQLYDKSQKMITESYGFHAPENRESPASAREAAQQLNYSLEQHRSRCLRQSDLCNSDILFFFDKRNKSGLASYYNAKNAFFINDLLPVNKAMKYEVTDPYGLDVEGVKLCYEEIEMSVQQLIHYCEDSLYGR
ncbi:ATP-grasp domain-containing protein [Photobacterium nomapromontoriensis]|uniref:arsenate reductase/protein-tyrosine-phosphatase family protein n=1 Tax=Photobacterium nomapromontoriensis TaxID=2910237 RepID=UPI003D13634D